MTYSLERKQHDFDDAYDLVKTKFPKIAKLIELGWGSRELNEHMADLLQQENNDRQGFPMDVMSALMLIHDRHMTEFSFKPFAPSTIFSLPNNWNI